MMHEGHEGVTELTKIDYLSAFFDIYTFSTRTKMFFFYQTLHVFDIVNNICWKISFLEKSNIYTINFAIYPNQVLVGRLWVL